MTTRTAWPTSLIAEIASHIYSASNGTNNTPEIAVNTALAILDAAEKASAIRQKAVDESIVLFRQEALKIKLEMKAEKENK